MASVTLASPLSGGRVTSSSPGASYFAPDLMVRGRIECSGVLEIDGAMQGDIQAENLIIGQNGRVRATIDAGQAVVAGTVQGVLKSKSVTFAQGCSFEGDVEYEAIGVEPDAIIQGAMIPVMGPGGRPSVAAPTPVAALASVARARVVAAEYAPEAQEGKSPATGRAVLWAVTLAGVLVGAVLAAMVGGLPPIQHLWSSPKAEHSAAAAPTEDVAPKVAIPPEAQVPTSAPKPTEAAAPEESATKAAAQKAKDAAALKAKIEADVAARTAAAKAKAEAAAVAKAKAEAEAQKQADAAAKADAEAKSKATAAVEASKEQAASAKAAAPLEVSEEPVKAVTSRKNTTKKSSASEQTNAEKGAAPSCSWVQQCSGPDKTSCVSVRQCSGD